MGNGKKIKVLARLKSGMQESSKKYHFRKLSFEIGNWIRKYSRAGYFFRLKINQIKILVEKNIVPKKLGISLKNMVGFRNIAIHDYSRIDIKILKSILKKNLKDLEDFYSLILKKLKLVE